MNLLMDDKNNWLKNNENMGAIITDVIKASLEEEGFLEDVEISLTLTDNKEIRKINLEYRNMDRETDVISFPQIDWSDDFLDFKGYTNIVGEDIMLGDIVISTEKLENQAKEYNHTLERELGFLIAHSMLHLLGYDHINPEEEEKMINKQEKILGKLGLVR